MHAFDTQSKRALKLDIRQKFVIMLSSTSNSYRDLKFLNNIDNFHPKQGQYLLYFVTGCHAQLTGDGVEGIEVHCNCITKRTSMCVPVYLQRKGIH